HHSDLVHWPPAAPTASGARPGLYGGEPYDGNGIAVSAEQSGIGPKVFFRPGPTMVPATLARPDLDRDGDGRGVSHDLLCLRKFYAFQPAQAGTDVRLLERDNVPKLSAPAGRRRLLALDPQHDSLSGRLGQPLLCPGAGGFPASGPGHLGAEPHAYPVDGADDVRARPGGFPIRLVLQ